MPIKLNILWTKHLQVATTVLWNGYMSSDYAGSRSVRAGTVRSAVEPER